MMRDGVYAFVFFVFFVNKTDYNSKFLDENMLLF